MIRDMWWTDNKVLKLSLLSQLRGNSLDNKDSENCPKKPMRPTSAIRLSLAKPIVSRINFTSQNDNKYI